MTERASWLPLAHLRCRAPYQGRGRAAGRRTVCNALLAVIPGRFQYLGTADRAPDPGTPRTDPCETWLPCPNHKCGAWNRFRLLPVEASVEV
jgi:hypothetical protein